jgi:hypothetical protein
MKSLFLASGVLLSAGVCAAEPVYWANTVVTPGVVTNNWNGRVNAYAGSYGSQSYTVTPFDAAFATTGSGAYGAQILAIAPGTSLELSFGSHGYAATSAAINDGGFNLGIQAGVGITDTNYGTGTTGTAAADYTNPREAVVAVSQDGNTWKYLQYNGVTGSTAVEPNPAAPSLYQWVADSAQASLISFDVPTNYFNSSSIGPDGVYAPGTVPANTPVADFSKPFLGTLSALSNQSWPQILNSLGGSAGGTWLDVAGTGLSSINYIEFTVPSSATSAMYVQAVVGVVPEPATLACLLVGMALPLLCRGKRMITRS